MSWLLITHDISSAFVVALCWWLSHVSASRRDISGKLAALGYAVLASLVAVTAFGPSAPANTAVADWLLISGKLGLVLVFAMSATRGKAVEKR